MTDARTFLSRPLLWLIAVCSLPLIVAPLLQYLAIAPFGSEKFLWLEAFLFLPFLAALLALVIAPFLLLVRRLRPFAVRSLIGSVVFVVAAFVGIRIGLLSRRQDRRLGHLAHLGGRLYFLSMLVRRPRWVFTPRA